MYIQYICMYRSMVVGSCMHFILLYNWLSNFEFTSLW